MVEEQIVIRKELIEKPAISLKTYFFHSISVLTAARNHLLASASDYGIDKRGQIALAFLYGYQGSVGYVDGADIMIFRDPEEENTMIDSWTIENGVYVYREDGTMCSTELGIAAIEDRLRRSMRNNLSSYLQTWPEIPNDASRPVHKPLRLVRVKQI